MTEYILSFNLIEFIVRSKSILILNCKALVYVYKKIVTKDTWLVKLLKNSET